MKFKPAFFASVIISIALALFSRFGVSAYAQLFVFSFEQIEAAWIVGAGLFVVIKSIQSTPLCYRLQLIRGIGYEWLLFAALVATAIDVAITLTAWAWVESGGIKLLNIIVSIGSIGWAGLIRLMVLQWLPDRPLVVPPPQSSPLRMPQQETSRFQPTHDRAVTITRDRAQNTDRAFVSQLIPKVASLFIAGLSGSGKDFVGSILAEYLQSKFNAKIFFIDPKNDPDEHLWDNADYQYRFIGTMMEPDEYLGNLKKAFKQYGERLAENGSSQYTILVLNELATCATKCDNSSDKKWLSATLQPMLSGLDSAGGAVIVLTQTLIMPTGFNSGTVSQFQKLIICREEQIENLSTQSKTVLMTGVDLSGAADACDDSPVDRAIYSSSLRKWLSLPKMRQGQSYYDRDSRCWIGSPPEPTARNKNSDNGGDRTVLPEIWQSGSKDENLHDSVTATPLASGEQDYELEDAILEFFQSVDGARNLNQIATSRRVRSAGGNAAKVRHCLNQLSEIELLIATDDGWLLPH